MARLHPAPRRWSGVVSTPNPQQPASGRRLTSARQSSDGVLAALEHNALSIISSALPQRGYPALFNRYGAGAHFDAHAASAGAQVWGYAPREHGGSPLCEWISA